MFVLFSVCLRWIYYFVPLFVAVSTSAIDCLGSVICKMTYYMSGGTINPTHLTQLLQTI